MPRLIGKKNNAALYAVVGVLVAVFGAIALDYFGAVNFIPNFGKEANRDNDGMDQPSSIERESYPNR